MKLRILILLCCMSFSLMASAQASGGQIRRVTPRQHHNPNRKITPSQNKQNAEVTLSQAHPKTYTVREMFEMGQSFYDKGDYTEALKWYKKAAENGSSDAQSELGFMYLNGEGTPIIKSEGVKWLIKAGENGDAMAQRTLGFMYRNGDVVYKSESEAIKWFRKAAPKFYETARGSMKSDGQVALQFFSWVCEMRQAPYDVWSLFHIGEIYYYAEGGVHTDYQEAAKYFKAASDLGNQVAMYYMGICYETGNGVPKDMIKAKDYYKKSGYEHVPSRDF